MARTKKDKNIDLGSSALHLSRFEEDYDAFEQKVKEEAEARLQVEKLKSLERKRKFEELNDKYKHAYTETIMEYAPKILEKFGVRISGELKDVIKNEANIQLMNKTGSFKSVLEEDRVLLSDILAYLSERDDICLEIMAFVEKRNAKSDY